MYCPQCASQNVDGAKFCRGCGTDLEGVALALTNRQLLASAINDRAKTRNLNDWLEKRDRGIRTTVQGSILLGTSLLIAVGLGLFTHIDAWMIIWAVFFGWMACWGAISLAFGLTAVMESRSWLARFNRPTQVVATTGLLDEPDAAVNLDAISSVTENTTAHLEQRPPATKSSMEHG